MGHVRGYRKGIASRPPDAWDTLTNGSCFQVSLNQWDFLLLAFRLFVLTPKGLYPGLELCPYLKAVSWLLLVENALLNDHDPAQPMTASVCVLGWGLGAGTECWPDRVTSHWQRVSHDPISSHPRHMEIFSISTHGTWRHFTFYSRHMSNPLTFYSTYKPFIPPPWHIQTPHIPPLNIQIPQFPHGTSRQLEAPAFTNCNSTFDRTKNSEIERLYSCLARGLSPVKSPGTTNDPQ